MTISTPMTVAKNLIMQHEGLKLKAYQCPEGRWSIGYGRNLQDKGITEAEALHLLANDITYFYRELERVFIWFRRLDDVRKVALVDMAFMGMESLLGFKRMLLAMSRGRYADAAHEALDSKWARQVGGRATTISNMLRTGVLPDGLR